MVRKKMIVLLFLVLVSILNAQVEVLWFETFSPGFFHGIAVNSNDEIIIGGSTGSEINLKKYSTQGELIWSNIFSSAYDVGDIVTDVENNIFVSVSSTTDFNIKILKLSSDGTQIWLSESFTSEYSWATNIALAPNGDVVAVGSDNINDGWAVIRIDEEGNTVWQKSFNPLGLDDMTAQTITFDNDGNIIISGNAGKFFATLKCDNLGNIIWHKEENYTTVYGDIGATDVVCDSENNIFIVGSSSLDDKIRLVKYNANGDLQFEKDGTDNYACFDIELYNDSTLVTVGGIGVPNGGYLTDIMVAAFNLDGELMFDYITDIGYTDAIYRAKLDSKNKLIGVGQASEQSGDLALLIKFNIDITADIEDNHEAQITNCELKQNYPNPFNPITKINYELANTDYESAEIEVYNAMGQMVWNSKPLPLNTNHCFFDGSLFNSGIYYYSLIVDGQKMATKSMVLIK